MSSSFAHLDPDFTCAEIRVSLTRLRDELAAGFRLAAQLPSTLEWRMAQIFSALGNQAIPSECWRILQRFRDWDQLRGRLSEVELLADSKAYQQYCARWTEAGRTARPPKLPPVDQEDCSSILNGIIRKLGERGVAPANASVPFYLLGDAGRIILSVQSRPDHTVDVKWIFLRGMSLLNGPMHNGLCGIATACDPLKFDVNVMDAIADEALERLELLRFAFYNPSWRVEAERHDK